MLKKIALHDIFVVVVHFMVLPACVFDGRAQAPNKPIVMDASAAYNQLVTVGRKALESGKTEDALLASVAAIEKDTKRFEAYVLGALVYQAKGDLTEARKFMSQALERAPEAKKPALQEIAKTLEQPGTKPAPSTAPVATSKELSGESRRKFDILMLIVEDADKAKSRQERFKALAEFLDKSAEFSKTNPQLIELWSLRAASALELDNAPIGWDAGRKLISMGAGNNDDPKMRKLLATLERRGWLSENQPEIPNPPTGSERWTNSIGMIFVPVDGVAGMFSIWETRVGDFKRFVDDTGHNAVGEMLSLESDGISKHSRTWMNPGFSQTEKHPVVGVNLDDVNAFCQWLSEKELRAGILRAGQFYRLPKYNGLEWRKAWGAEIPKNSVKNADGSTEIVAVYPWGRDWPPPAGVGNLPGIEARNGSWPSDIPIIRNSFDEFPRTSPVGSFKPTKNGIYDLIGNVDELMGDEEHFVAGYSWRNPTAKTDYFVSKYLEPPLRSDSIGFRCVLVARGERSSADDSTKPADYVRQDREKDDAASQVEAGLVYARQENFTEARKCFEKAASAGSMTAQFNLGLFSEKGQGGPIDYLAARKWFQLAAEKGNDEASYKLSKLYIAGLGVEPSDEKALQYLKSAADSGHAEAQNELGEWFMWGMNGVSKDADKAREYYEKSVTQGSYFALGSLATWFNFYTPRNMTEAETKARSAELSKRVYQAARKAAEAGDVHAQSFYGQALIDGREVLPANEAEGRRWLDKAMATFVKQSDNGDAVATMDLAWLYLNGSGGLKDTGKANAYLEKAINQGYKTALEKYGKYFKEAANSASQTGSGSPEQMIETFRTALGVKNDEQWTVIKMQIDQIMEAKDKMSNREGRSSEQKKAARQLAGAREKLRKLLTKSQEKVANSLGLLQ